MAASTKRILIVDHSRCKIPKIIAYTGYATLPEIAEAIAASFSALVLKPAPIPVLLEAVEKVLGGN